MHADGDVSAFVALVYSYEVVFKPTEHCLQSDASIFVKLYEGVVVSLQELGQSCCLLVVHPTVRALDVILFFSHVNWMWFLVKKFGLL